MRFFAQLMEKYKLASECRAEFNEANTRYNNKSVSVLSVLAMLLLGFSMTMGFVSTLTGEYTSGEFWLILPYHIFCIAVSGLSFILLRILDKRGHSHRAASDIVACGQVCVLMSVMLYSSHVEIPIIGIKNINVIILVMFTLGFFLRFRLSVTLILETLFLSASLIFLILEKNYISNYFPSLVNLVASFVIACCAACMYWKTRFENFIFAKDMEAIAMSDALTRLHNRRSFDAYIQYEWERTRKEGLSIAMYMIDIDKLKEYNDTYGHPEGDKCLTAVANVISESIRKNDFAARYGGEEFVVVLTGVTAESAGRIASNMIDAIRKRNIPHENSPVVPYVTLSIGCMVQYPESPEISMQEFIVMADDALYMAKNQGRDRFIMHPSVIK